MITNLAIESGLQLESPASPLPHLPWKVIPFHSFIDKNYRKKDISPTILKQIALNQIEQTKDLYPHFTHIYTDGSTDPSSGRAAAAGICMESDMLVAARCTDFSSSTATELAAIRIALNQWFQHHLVIHTDSLSAINLIDKYEPKDKVVLDIQSLIKERRKLSKQTVLHWIPSHVGIQGNEKADICAKNIAKTRQRVDIATPISFSIIKKNIHKTISRAKIINHDNQGPTDSYNWYNKVKAEVPPPNLKMSRFQPTAIHRFRLGYRRWADIPTYPNYAPCTCQAQSFNIAHVIAECPDMDRSPLLLKTDLYEYCLFDIH